MLQAELAAVHVRANHAEDTDWPQLLRLYDELLALQPSPVVALNRAVALSHAIGPAQASPMFQKHTTVEEGMGLPRSRA